MGNEDTPTFQIVYRCFSLWHILLIHLRKCILAAATALVIYTRANLLFYSSLPQQSHCGRLTAQLFDWIWWRFPISCHGNQMVFLQLTRNTHACTHIHTHVLAVSSWKDKWSMVIQIYKYCLKHTILHQTHSFVLNLPRLPNQLMLSPSKQRGKTIWMREMSLSGRFNGHHHHFKLIQRCG